SNATPTIAVPGLMDEVRITTLPGAFDDDWIQTEYANQHDPDSFYSIGAEPSIPLLVHINGVSADPLLATFNIMAPLSGISTMRADFDSDGSPVFRPDLDQEIEVFEFGEKIFGGY